MNAAMYAAAAAMVSLETTKNVPAARCTPEPLRTASESAPEMRATVAMKNIVSSLRPPRRRIPEMIHIQPYAAGDAESLYEAAAESVNELEPWMPWCHRGYALGDARAWVARQIESFGARSEFDFFILDDDGGFVGGVGLNQFDAANQRANLGYWVRTSKTRRGYATAAVRQLVRWAAENTELQRLEVVVAARNAASLRVAQKAGAAREGILRHRLKLHGIFHDAVMHAFVRGENMAVGP
jgi:RimJ/RimL family protein N-acetyltransferase